jgi:hypothetical protein
MKKYAITAIVIAFSISSAVAQLILSKLESSRIVKNIAIGSTIEIKLSTETSRLDCNCFKAYKGSLLYADRDSAVVSVFEEIRQYIDIHNASIKELNIYSNIQDARIKSVNLAKVLSISRYRYNYQNTQNMGVLLTSLAVLSNLFIVPNIKKPNDRVVRNGGYAVIVTGIALVFLPKRKTYYFEQPKKSKKKTLWKLGS